MGRLVGLLVLCAFATTSIDAAFKDVLARSDFHWGDEDWTVFGPGKVQIYARGGMLYGSDKGKKVWYFRAPDAFIGDKCFAHNGELSFRLGHSEYMSNGKDMIREWDVILESKLWRLRFGVRDVIPPWVGSTKQSLSLNERAWTNIATGHAPTTIEMLRMLTAVSALYIRGGFYDGHEETWIDEVVMTEGDHKEDVLLRRIEKHAVHPSVHKEREKAKAQLEEESKQVIAEETHIDLEEQIAKQHAANKIKEKERAEREQKEKEERAKREEEERLAAERAAFERSVTEQERAAAQVLSHHHEEKGQAESDLTAEDISYAVDEGEKEMLRKLREQAAQAEIEREERERLQRESHAHAEERRKEAAAKLEREHEKHLSGSEHIPHERDGHDGHDVHDLHHKAHLAAQARKEREKREQASAAAAAATPAPTPAPVLMSPRTLSVANEIEDDDISVEQASQIAQQQQQQEEAEKQKQEEAEKAKIAQALRKKKEEAAAEENKPKQQQQQKAKAEAKTKSAQRDDVQEPHPTSPPTSSSQTNSTTHNSTATSSIVKIDEEIVSSPSSVVRGETGEAVRLLDDDDDGVVMTSTTSRSGAKKNDSTKGIGIGAGGGHHKIAETPSSTLPDTSQPGRPTPLATTTKKRE